MSVEKIYQRSASWMWTCEWDHPSGSYHFGVVLLLFHELAQENALLVEPLAQWQLTSSPWAYALGCKGLSVLSYKSRSHCHCYTMIIQYLRRGKERSCHTGEPKCTTKQELLPEANRLAPCRRDQACWTCVDVIRGGTLTHHVEKAIFVTLSCRRESWGSLNIKSKQISRPKRTPNEVSK